MAKDKFLIIRIDPGLKEKAKAVAKISRRSLSDWIRLTIESAIKGSK